MSALPVFVTSQPVSTTPQLVASMPAERLGSWYAVHTRSNFEKRVAAELQEKQFETFLPLWEQQRQWKDRKHLTSFVLFPGYVFCRLPEQGEARLRVLNTPGVSRILGYTAGAQTPVAEAEIVAIRRLLDSRLPFAPYPYLQTGTRVRMKSGPLQGVEGVLVRTKPAMRLVLSVELLSQSVSAEVDQADVEVLHSA